MDWTRHGGGLDWDGSSGRETWMDCVTLGRLLHLSEPR